MNNSSLLRRCLISVAVGILCGMIAGTTWILMVSAAQWLWDLPELFVLWAVTTASSVTGTNATWRTFTRDGR